MTQSFLSSYVDPQALAPVGLTAEDNQRITQEVIDRVNKEFEDNVLRSPSDEERGAVRAKIGTIVAQVCRRLKVNTTTADEARLADEIARKVMGMGFLDLLLPPARTDLTEITVTPQGQLLVKIKGESRFSSVDNLSLDRDEVFRVLNAIIGPQGRSLNEATPSVDAKLPKTKTNPGGGRIKALHPAIVPGLGFPSLNIRLFEQKPVEPHQVVAWGSMSREMMDLLKTAVAQYLRIFIIGGTGTGKTTILSALANTIPTDDRIVKIEDPEEIFVNHPHVVTIEARQAPPGSEVPSYTIKDGVDDAMRMTPDWLVVGEVRKGDAAMSLFRAQMSDHPGMSTFHSESPDAAMHRLCVVMYADMGVRFEASKALFSQSVDLVVQLGYDDFDKRRTTEISQVEREMKGGNVRFTPLYVFDHEQSTADRPVWNKLNDLTRKRR